MERARQILSHSFWSFAQNLKCVLRTERHHREHPVYEVVRHTLVEQVAHAVDEDPSRLAPAKWLVEAVREQADFTGPAWPLRTFYGEAFVRLLQPARGEALGVAMVAA